MEKAYEFTIKSENQNMRVDKFVAGKIGELSRTKAQELLDNNKITVNSKPVKSSYKVQKNDRILVKLPSPQEKKILPEDIPLDIIYEDDWLVVINKPAGMLVHPTEREKSGTLVNALKAHCNLANLWEDERPGIVHRLDRDTSGVIVVAKRDSVHEFLTNLFAERKVHKEYIAIVCGIPSIEVGKINASIGRDKNDYTMRTIDNFDEKESITTYKVIEKYNRFALLEIFPKTGRTHQIRLHMSYIGHPVVGDPDYGGGMQRSIKEAPSKKSRDAFIKLSRQALHARMIEFEHPQYAKLVRFFAPIPEDIQQVIDVLSENQELM